jgi:hypothetical protein
MNPQWDTVIDGLLAHTHEGKEADGLTKEHFYRFIIGWY